MKFERKNDKLEKKTQNVYKSQKNNPLKGVD
jgi:hypothetical protein